MNLAPIILFAYNRPAHLTQTLAALAQNDLASQSELFIYCDGAKESASEEEIERIVKTRNVARAVSGFRTMTMIEREKNIGLKANIVGAVTEIVNRYGRVIVLEDDIVTSPGFLRYMNEALELYKDDEQVMHISGYMWPHRWPLPETFFFSAPCPWGWATWARAWKHYDDDAKKLYHKWENHWDEFNKFGGDYLQKQLEANNDGRLNTWYVKWHAAVLQHGGMTLYPGRSLTSNIGFDTMGTHCDSTDKFDVAPVDTVRVKRIPIHENRLAAHEIYAFYQGRWYNKRRRKALLNRIKNFIYFWK